MSQQPANLSRPGRVPRAQARRRIVEATVRLLDERRFRDLSVDAVMCEAGLSRTVFYRYFDGLPHVIIGLLDELVDQVVDLAVTAGRPGDPDVARTALKRTVDTFDRHGKLIRGLLDAVALDAEVETAYRALVDRAVAAMAALIADGVRAGRLRADTPADVARALTLLNGHYLLDALDREPRVDPEVALETLWAVWTRTLGMTAGGSDDKRLS